MASGADPFAALRPGFAKPISVREQAAEAVHLLKRKSITAAQILEISPELTVAVIEGLHQEIVQLGTQLTDAHWGSR